MCYTGRRNSSSQRKGAPISCCCVQYNIQLESSAGAAIAAALRCSQRRLRSLQSSPCFYCHYIAATAAASSKESMLAFKVVPLQLLDKQKKNVNCHFAAKFDSIRGNTHTITCHSWGLQQQWHCGAKWWNAINQNGTYFHRWQIAVNSLAFVVPGPIERLAFSHTKLFLILHNSDIRGLTHLIYCSSNCQTIWSRAIWKVVDPLRLIKNENMKRFCCLETSYLLLKKHNLEFREKSE